MQEGKFSTSGNNKGLRCPFKPILCQEGYTEADLAIAWYDEANDRWQPLNVSIVYPELGIITDVVHHFSLFTIITLPGEAVFLVGEMVIAPAEAYVGDEVKIIFPVTNRGTRGGSFEVTLVINDIAEESQVVTLAPYESKMVTFTVTRDSPGIYRVEVNKLTGLFIVKEKPVAPPPPPPTPPPAPRGIPNTLIAGIIGGALVALAIYLVRRRRYRLATAIVKRARLLLGKRK